MSITGMYYNIFEKLYKITQIFAPEFKIWNQTFIIRTKTTYRHKDLSALFDL